MTHMNKHFEENARSWGPEGADWFHSIPTMIAEYEAKWHLKVLPPFSLNYNYVAPAERADGTHAVLKIGFPKDTEFQSEMKALRIFDGQAINQLIEADTQNAVMLIERFVPGTPLDTYDDDDVATRTIVRVMQKLHKPLPASHSFITLETWSSAIPDLKNKFNGTTGPLPTYLVDKAEALFRDLIASSAPPVLLHGDLHHGNILLSEQKGWVAIDPKGVAAEPAYEVAAMIRNPYEKLKNITDLKPLLTRRIEILTEVSGIDRARIYAWCFAQTVLAAVWSVDGPKGWQHAIRVAETLNALKILH